MESAVQLRVPLQVKMKIGQRWGSMAPYNVTPVAFGSGNCARDCNTSVEQGLSKPSPNNVHESERLFSPPCDSASTMGNETTATVALLTQRKSLKLRTTSKFVGTFSSTIPLPNSQRKMLPVARAIFGKGPEIDEMTLDEFYGS
jgi:hypothetical protein